MPSRAEQRASRIALVLIGGLLLAYVGFKAWHITVAVKAYQSQPITADTSQAAK